MSRKPLKRNGTWACVSCHADFGLPTLGGKRVRPPVRCSACWPLHALWTHWLNGRQTAAYHVALAIKKGQMPRAAGFACVDCGKPAIEYDHRDYGKPLDVVPVCRSCNVKRGSAKPLNPFLVAALVLANADNLANSYEFA